MKKRIILSSVLIIIIAVVSFLTLSKLCSHRVEVKPNPKPLYPPLFGRDWTAGYYEYINKPNPYYDALSTEQKQKIIALSPQQVIEMYENTNEYKIALALLSSYWLSRSNNAEEDVKDEVKYRKHREIVSCKDITKERNQNMGLPPLPSGVVEFEVSFATKEWPDLLFINLDKYPYDGHWQIIGVGTSP